jgi:hypothetical protein
LTDEKQRWEESEKRQEEERRPEKRQIRRKKVQVHEKVEKNRETVCFSNDLWFRRVEEYAR